MASGHHRDRTPPVEGDPERALLSTSLSTVEAIAQAVEEAELMAGCEIRPVWHGHFGGTFEDSTVKGSWPSKTAR